MVLPVRVLLQTYGQAHGEGDDECEHNGSDDGKFPPAPSSETTSFPLTDMSKFLCISVTPNTDAEIAAIVTLFLAALPGRIAESPTCQRRHYTVLLCALLCMLDRVDVKVCRIIAVGACCGDTNFGRGRGRLGPLRVQDDGKALPCRRRYAFGRPCIMQRLM